eukprot:6784198-Prymnesium_polylepis.1
MSEALVPAPVSLWTSAVERGSTGCCLLVMDGHDSCQRDQIDDLTASTARQGRSARPCAAALVPQKARRRQQGRAEWATDELGRENAGGSDSLMRRSLSGPKGTVSFHNGLRLEVQHRTWVPGGPHAATYPPCGHPITRHEGERDGGSVMAVEVVRRVLTVASGVGARAL